jgi:hypothetical protein
MSCASPALSCSASVATGRLWLRARSPTRRVTGQRKAFEISCEVDQSRRASCRQQTLAAAHLRGAASRSRGTDRGTKALHDSVHSGRSERLTGDIRAGRGLGAARRSSLNPRVRGSSPWRRTRAVLVVLPTLYLSCRPLVAVVVGVCPHPATAPSRSARRPRGSAPSGRRQDQ